jgi:hypothetical protein
MPRLLFFPHNPSSSNVMKKNEKKREKIVHVLCSLMPLERDVLEINTPLALV